MTRTHAWTPAQLQFLRDSAGLSEADLALGFRVRWLTVAPLGDRAIARRRYTLLRAERRHAWTDEQLDYLAAHAADARPELVRGFRAAFPGAERYVSDAAIANRRYTLVTAT